MEMDSGTGRNFSFVREELHNLADVPREFDGALYEKLGVSRTVVEYWTETGYKPPYYYLFWLLQRDVTRFRFEEYRVLRDKLISGVCKENARIGRELELYADNEDESYESYIASNGSHMYFLSDEFDDGSGSTLAASVEYGDLISRMEQEVSKNKKEGDKVEYRITKYPVLLSSNHCIKGVDMENSCGELLFDSGGVLKYMSDIQGFRYDDMDAGELLDPYVFIPHPFKRGDIVRYRYGEGYSYGVLSYAADIDAREGERLPAFLDSSAFTATIETVCKAGDGERYIFGHDHVCPVYLEEAMDGEGLDGKLRLLLMTASDIIKGRNVSLSDLSYCMG